MSLLYGSIPAFLGSFGTTKSNTVLPTESHEHDRFLATGSGFPAHHGDEVETGVSGFLHLLLHG